MLRKVIIFILYFIIMHFTHVVFGNNKCNLVKTCILGMMPGKRRGGRPRMQYIDNIKKWTRASLEENVRLTEDRTAWRERSCAAGAANVRTDDAD